MAIRITGMNSGLDTDSIIAELVKASSSKKNALTKAQTKLEWKQDAWKSLNKKVYSFFNSTLNNMRFSSSYNKKATTVANANIASVVAGDNAVSGTQSLTVKQLAKAGYLTGGKLSENNNIKKTSTLNETSGLNSGLTGAGDINVTVGGKTSTISVNGDSTVDSVITQLNKAGVQASFDAKNQRIFINVAESGSTKDFTLSATNENGLKALSSLGLLTESDITGNAEYKEWAAYAGIDDSGTAANLATRITSTSAANAATIQSDIASLQSNIMKYQDSINNSTTGFQTLLDGITSSQSYMDIAGTTSGEKLTSVQDQIKSVNEKLEYIGLKEKDSSTLSETQVARLDELETKSTEEAWGTLDKEALTTESKELQKNLQTVKKAISYESSILNANKNIYNAHAAIADKAYVLNDYYDDQIGNNPALTSEEITVLNEKITGNNQAISDGSAYETTFTNTYPDADVNPMPTGASYNLVSSVTETLVQKVNTAVSAIANVSTLTSGSAVRVLGQNAKIELNGAEFESASNSFTVNGLTITAKQVSDITGYTDGTNELGD
ncbi:MAG TPA: flagellar cap protein FliD N-terminal domain-containing protein, partial [Lachnospiraceae bacterium]|nr:flagellar cap protein FliD N-terminal domain-containing protein [Lachnospiraceae bacterium]